MSFTLWLPVLFTLWLPVSFPLLLPVCVRRFSRVLFLVSPCVLSFGSHRSDARTCHQIASYRNMDAEATDRRSASHLDPS